MAMPVSHCEMAELADIGALGALPVQEQPAIRAHIATCRYCQRELTDLCAVLDRLVSWPTDVLRPTPTLQARLAHRVAGKGVDVRQWWVEPDWTSVASGIECKLLAADHERHRMSML